MKAANPIRPRQKAADACQVFLHCENVATTTLDHPTLGAVPSCQRCFDRIKSIEAAT